MKKGNDEIALVVGARPNFMKAFPLREELRRRRIKSTLIHTGQHYDYELSKAFFEDFKLGDPEINLCVGSGSHGEQTGRIIIELEKVLLRKRPGIVMVFGDVNSTVATALVTSKMNIPLAHVEAGLRSFDRTMPEEINRILTDRIADYLFTPSADANENLKKEGIDDRKIFFVGNIMIDSLKKYLLRARKREYYRKIGLQKGKYWLLTLHRPSNVDNKAKLSEILSSIDEIRKDRPIVFPMHPRARKMIADFDIQTKYPWILGGRNFTCLSPLGYIDFLSLECFSEAVITDSGGMQEETTYLNIPCLTIRSNTERPITTKMGTNTLCLHRQQIIDEAKRIFEGKRKMGRIPELWDGSTAKRIVDIVSKRIE